jgi:hypothetical protein
MPGHCQNRLRMRSTASPSRLLASGRGSSRGYVQRYGEEITVGISLGGILVIVGIVLMFVWSFWAGLIVALIGLIVFGGFARGKWY